MSQEFGWYVAEAGKPVGPLSLDDLVARVRRNPDSLVFGPGVASWTPAHAVDASLVRAREHAGRRTSVARPEDVQLQNAAVFRALAAEVGDPELRRVARRKEAALLIAAGKGLLRRGALLAAARCFGQTLTVRR